MLDLMLNNYKGDAMDLAISVEAWLAERGIELEWFVFEDADAEVLLGGEIGSGVLKRKVRINPNTPLENRRLVTIDAGLRALAGMRGVLRFHQFILDRDTLDTQYLKLALEILMPKDQMLTLVNTDRYLTIQKITTLFGVTRQAAMVRCDMLGIVSL